MEATDRPPSVEAFASLLPGPPTARTPGWVGQESTLDVPSRSPAKASELRVRTSHPCRLYVDGSETGEFRPGESYTIGVEPGTHDLRAVRTDRAATESVTVTATGPPEEDEESDRMSLEALVWQDVVSTSKTEPTDTDINFAAAGAGGRAGADDDTVRLDG